MNQKSRIYLAVISAAVILLAVVLAVSMGTAGNEEVTITIYHTNDMHGHLEDLAYTIPLRDATPNALLVSAGDDTQGTLLTTATNGTAVLTLMNAADYDLMTLGNHEFDKGAAHAAELAGLAEFPVLSANTIYPNGTALLGNDGNYILETGGKRIGFFGITTTETAGPYSEFICTDEIRLAKNQTIRLAERDVDLIVALVHIWNDPSSSPTSYDLAEAVPEIDLIIDGHSHTVIQDKVGNTTIMQTGAFFQNLGRINITFAADGPSIETSLIPAEDLRNGAADPAYAALYANLSDLSGAGYERVIGNSTTPLAANAGDRTRLVRMQEMPLGDLVADSMLWCEKDSCGYETGRSEDCCGGERRRGAGESSGRKPDAGRCLYGAAVREYGDAALYNTGRVVCGSGERGFLSAGCEREVFAGCRHAGDD